jgi:heat-inducible transcriptional repressor
VATQSLESDSIAKIELIKTSSKSARIIIITSTNVLTNSIIFDTEYDFDNVQQVIATIDDVLLGKTIAEAKKLLQNPDLVKDIGKLIVYHENIINSFIEVFTQFSKENVYTSGVSRSLIHPELSKPQSVKRLFQLLEDKQLIKLIDEEEELSVQVKNNLRILPYEDYTLITMPYDTKGGESGTIAVVGPNRMDYQKVISLLQYLAKLMNNT